MKDLKQVLLFLLLVTVVSILYYLVSDIMTGKIIFVFH
jgi:hypothetical protein